MIVLTRVDNRLIHGQVIEAWLPFLKVARIVVADEEAATNALARAAMGLAVPSGVEVSIEKMSTIDFARIARDNIRTLLLLRDVASVEAAQARGLPPGLLNLGNVHAGNARKQRTRSVFLSDKEVESLWTLEGLGMHVEIQAVPAEKPVALRQLQT